MSEAYSRNISILLPIFGLMIFSFASAALLVREIAVTNGPLVAPTVGGALVVNLPQTGWRWTEYVHLIPPELCLRDADHASGHWNFARSDLFSKPTFHR